MSRRSSLLALLLLAFLVPGLPAPDLRAGPAEEGAGRIAWHRDLAAARRAAEEAGRPILVALHRRPAVATEATQRDLDRWIAVYRHPDLVHASRRVACVLRMLPPADDAAQAGATHLVVDVRSRELARLALAAPEDPAEGARRLQALLRAGLARAGLAADVPPLEAVPEPVTGRDLAGISATLPVTVPAGAPGVRLRLRWPLPVPVLEGAGAEAPRIDADVHVTWDDAGPFAVGRLEAAAGDEVDVPVDLRFDAIEGLADLATEGLHRVDVFLVPREGSYPFVASGTASLHVGRVWIRLGAGGGGGGGGEGEQEAPPEPPPPPPTPDEAGAETPPPPPPPEREEVVDPFVNEGETVEKEDALVAVEDPDGGVKPPRQVPLEEALRRFERMQEEAVAREDISAAQRRYLLRYFELLREAARKRAK